MSQMVDGNGKKNGGGHDNLTLVIVETKEKSELKEKMKNKTTLILGIIAIALAVIVLMLNSCHNESIDVDTFRITQEQVLPGADTVSITGTYDFFKEAESMKINIGRDSTLADALSHAMALSGKDYAVTVKTLQANTQYYYNYSVNVGVKDDFITPTKSFRTLQAQNYTVSVIAIPNEGGIVSGGGTYEQGQQCTVMATANEGYTFINWMENDSVVTVDSIYRFSVTGNRVLIAKFEAIVLEEYTIAVSANPANGGSVTGGGSYQQGQSCTVRATANTGYTFVNWTENGNQVSANANYTFTVNGNRTLVANFTADSYIISATVDPENSGTITGAGGYEYGQSCTLRATANMGYTFEKWTENGTQVSTNATYTFTVSGNRSLVAHFKVNSYTITVSANPAAGGVAIGGGTFEYGQSCTLSATANSGYNFSNWTEGGNVVSSNSSYTFTVTGNRTLKANFTQQAPQNYTISVSANPTNGGSVTGGGTYQQGQSCTVRATANSGYTFSKWTENGNQVSTSANYTFTVTGNRTLVAHFTANPQNYTITVLADPTNGGSVSGGGSYQQGQNCTVTATANSGYTFSNWTENGNVVSSNTSYSFIVTGNRTLVSHFIANPQSYTISVSANPTNGGSVSGGGTYQQGQSCTVHATANNGYTFVNWTENGTQVSTNANYTFTVNSNCNLVANFEQSSTGGWLYYDDGTYATSVGNGGELYWGSMFLPSMLASYAGMSLTKVAIYTSHACSAILNIYVGGSQPSTNSLVHQQHFEMVGDHDFMEITLINPVSIDGTQNLWITFCQVGEEYPADACGDTGEPNNRWVSIDGASWEDLASVGLQGYGWMIRGWVSDGRRGETCIELRPNSNKQHTPNGLEKTFQDCLKK